MKIELKGKDRYQKDFAEYIKSQLQKRILSQLNSTDLTSFAEYLNSSDKIKRMFSGEVSLSKLFEFSVYTIEVIEYKDRWEITFNKDKLLPNSKMKVVDFVDMFSYGTMGLRGNKSIRNSFEYIVKNIGSYETMYMLGLGVNIGYKVIR